MYSIVARAKKLSNSLVKSDPQYELSISKLFSL